MTLCDYCGAEVNCYGGKISVRDWQRDICIDCACSIQVPPRTDGVIGHFFPVPENPPLPKARLRENDFTVTILSGWSQMNGKEVGFSVKENAEAFIKALEEDGIQCSLYIEMA